MKNIKTKWFTFATYLLLILAILLIGYVLLHNNKTLNNVITSFFEAAENRSFDYRQSLKITHKPPIPNKDIVVLAIDDASLESLWDKYGEWPVPRKVFADLIHHIEKDQPQAIIFDLLFIKSMKYENESDKALIGAMNKYDNIYTGMNLDDQAFDVRQPIDLPDRLAFNLKNESNLSLKEKYSYLNCRPILDELINGKVHVGLTNVVRSDDGIIRKVAPLFEYKEKYYPYLAFDAAYDYLAEKESKDLTIDKNKNLTIKDTVIPFTEDGDVILNWYGQSGTHALYPIYKVLKQADGEKVDENYNFKDKIVIIGTTAVSLHDTKSVPVQESVYPGVEVHATFFNNMLDNNFIKQSSDLADAIIIIAVIGIVGFIVMSSTSTVLAVLSSILFAIAYLFISYYAMILYNLWIPLVAPIIAIVLAFALSFLTKYMLKSKDFELQYRLATVDGLTDLYNHRYFQEALAKQVQIAQRYNQAFSLIMIDIDFFKKFNDNYGHQAGDAVLRQVAKILKNNSRTTDIVCRYGGEELCIILPNTSSEEALFNAKRINKAVEEATFDLNNSQKGKVTISVGVATFPDNANSPELLIEHADKGLYYAKEHGRNQVVCIKE